MIAFIDQEREQYGVESICRVLREALRQSTTSRRRESETPCACRRGIVQTRSCARRYDGSGRTTSESMELVRCGDSSYEKDFASLNAP